MENNLKPCPFCGGTAHIEVDDIQEPEMFWHYSPRCDDWGCLGHMFWFMYDTEEDAIEAWNTRHERTVIMETCRNLSEWHDVDEFICSKCGIILNGYAEVYYNEDGSTGIYEFACEYCPNCGAKVVE